MTSRWRLQNALVTSQYQTSLFYFSPFNLWWSRWNHWIYKEIVEDENLTDEKRSCESLNMMCCAIVSYVKSVFWFMLCDPWSMVFMMINNDQWSWSIIYLKWAMNVFDSEALLIVPPWWYWTYCATKCHDDDWWRHDDVYRTHWWRHNIKHRFFIFLLSISDDRVEITGYTRK